MAWNLNFPELCLQIDLVLNLTYAMTRFYLFYLLAATLLLNGACTHYFYAPNTLQTPFMQKQHDTRVSLGMISGNEFSGYELHAAYSPLKYTALMVNHFWVSGSSGELVDNGESGEGQMSEIALGAYYPMSEYATFSLYGGWGAGWVTNTYDLDVSAHLKFQRRFIQPTVAFQLKWARFGAAFRFNQLRYVKGDVDVEVGEPDLTIIRNIERASPLFVPEAGLSCGFGHKAFWADFNLNICNLRNRTDYHFAYSTFGMSFSCQLDYFWRKQATSSGSR